MADNLNVPSSTVTAPWCGRSIPSAVIGLFGPAGPHAVSGFVVPVVVNSFDGVFPDWARSHISQEIGEGAAPPIANSYAAPPISNVMGDVRVHAALAHAGPTCVFRESYSIGGLTFEGVASAPRASATNASPISDGLSLQDSDGAALATASKSNLPVYPLGIINNDPFAKLHSDLVDVIVRGVEVRHAPNYAKTLESYQA